jgi:Ca2+-binding RTX toxin-like protein
MKVRRFVQIALIGGAFGLVVISALAATNTVPASKAGRTNSAIAVNNLKPQPDCNGITVTALLVGVTGTNTAELIVGTAGADTMVGKNGDDCIVGGGGADDITGGAGTDVCIGGPGTDVNGGGCETFIQ